MTSGPGGDAYLYAILPTVTSSVPSGKASAATASTASTTASTTTTASSTAATVAATVCGGGGCSVKGGEWVQVHEQSCPALIAALEVLQLPPLLASDTHTHDHTCAGDSAGSSASASVTHVTQWFDKVVSHVHVCARVCGYPAEKLQARYFGPHAPSYLLVVLEGASAAHTRALTRAHAGTHTCAGTYTAGQVRSASVFEGPVEASMGEWAAGLFSELRRVARHALTYSHSYGGTDMGDSAWCVWALVPPCGASANTDTDTDTDTDSGTTHTAAVAAPVPSSDLSLSVLLEACGTLDLTQVTLTLTLTLILTLTDS